MSDDRSNIFDRQEEFLGIFKKGAEFTRELMTENERLRRRLLDVEDGQHQAARNPDDWEKLRVELIGTIANLKEENRSFIERLMEVEEENRKLADRYVEIEEENNNLANLYVASYQLHSTVEIDEVLKIVV